MKRTYEGIGLDVAEAYFDAADGSAVIIWISQMLLLWTRTIKEINPNAVIHCVAWDGGGYLKEINIEEWE